MTIADLDAALAAALAPYRATLDAAALARLEEELWAAVLAWAETEATAPASAP